MSAQPERRDGWEAPVDLDLRSMPSFLAHPPAANDADLRAPLMRRRRSLAMPLTVGLVGLASLAGAAAFVLGGAPAAEASRPDPARTAAITRPAPVPAPPSAAAPAGPDKLRETVTAPAGPIQLPEPRPAPEPVKEAARLDVPAPLPPPPPPVVPAPARPTLATADAERALRRAETLLEQGDISAARLFLERAADGGSGRALFRLAETYDPRALQRWGARGIKGAPDRARDLYRKAEAAGVAEAGARLAGLR